MSTRERWIVYPLLFLTLGIALRANYERATQFQANEIAAREIHCEKLQVGQMICDQSQFGQIRCDQAEVTQTARVRQMICDQVESIQSVCRSLFVNGSNGRPVVAAMMDPRNHNGLVEILSANRSPLIQLQSTAAGGGMVSASDHTGKAVLMGCIGENFGVFAHMPGTGLIIPLTQPWRFEAKDAIPLPPKGQAPTSAPTKQPAEKKDGRRSEGAK
jgi:hypothetical protein